MPQLPIFSSKGEIILQPHAPCYACALSNSQLFLIANPSVFQTILCKPLPQFSNHTRENSYSDIYLLFLLYYLTFRNKDKIEDLFAS